MGILVATAVVLTLSALFAIILARAPVGLRNYPQVSIIAADTALLIAAALIALEVGALLLFQVPRSLWPLVVTDYFLAMANRIVGGPFAFFWTPRWVYWVGNLTPLIAIGAALSIAAAYSTRDYAPRNARTVMTIAGCLLVAFVAGAVYAAVTTWGGIPL
jgi:hypothetical protein